MIVRRLVLLISIVFTGSLALAAAAAAAGGGGGLTPGQYTFTDFSASADFGGKGGPPVTSYSIFVNRGLNSFHSEDNQGSDRGTVMLSTMVQFTQIDPSGVSTFGCFIIPDGDFVVAGNLKSASLHTTLVTPNCPGIGGAPVGGAPQVGPKPAGGGGLALPIRIDITWTAPGVIATSHDRFNFSCLDRSENGTSTFRDSLGGSASGSIGTTTGLFSQGGDISSQNGTLEVEGNVIPPCFGK
ncbi:MAG TPA: hypothetical protein VLK30_09555 [Candidatus Limnocylindrales bacterium]|nr:hypothetical protein [Candidatus Limnocylindrales bacterium]